MQQIIYELFEIIMLLKFTLYIKNTIDHNYQYCIFI